MGLFSHSSPPIPISPDPLITYTFHQNLAGKLTITSSQQNTYAYTITLTKRKAWRETIEVAIHGGPYSNPLGSCLIETRRARFQDVQFDACGQYLRLERSTSALRGLERTAYTLSGGSFIPSTWEHDHEALGDSARLLKLSDSASGAVLARFGGGRSVDEFGVLEVYDRRVAADVNWCGYCVLTAVCVFAREERTREIRERSRRAVSKAGSWGGLLMGVPVGP